MSVTVGRKIYPSQIEITNKFLPLVLQIRDFKVLLKKSQHPIFFPSFLWHIQCIYVMSFIYNIPQNGAVSITEYTRMARCSGKDEVEGMWEVRVLVCFEVLFRNLRGKTERHQEYSVLCQPVSGYEDSLLNWNRQFYLIIHSDLSFCCEFINW